MKKGHMMELIQRLIHDAAVEQLKKKRSASPHDAPNMSDDELDLILFHGGMENLSESFDKVAKINSSDITAFEQQMNDIVANIPNAVLSFDKQPNGRSILLKNEGDSISVVSSGKISFGNGSITWMFSIPNGLRVSTEQMEVTQSNRDLIPELFNYYDSWQKDWRQKMLAPDGGKGSEQEELSGNSFKSIPGAPAGTPSPESGQTPDAGQAGNQMGV